MSVVLGMSGRLARKMEAIDEEIARLGGKPQAAAPAAQPPQATGSDAGANERGTGA